MKNADAGQAGLRQAKHFDEIGDLYLWVRRDLPITRTYYEFWTSELLRRGPNEVTGWSLDGLCGGADMAWEGKPGSRWIGLDIALNLLLDPPQVPSRPRVARVCGDVTRVPLRAGSLDGVYIRGALHHVPDYPRALGELFRALRPGGRLVMSEPSDDVAIFRWLRNTVYKMSPCFDEETEKAFRGAWTGALGMFKEYRSKGAPIGLAPDFADPYANLAALRIPTRAASWRQSARVGSWRE
jgi:SAM-dependent methyltransferase